MVWVFQLHRASRWRDRVICDLHACMCLELKDLCCVAAFAIMRLWWWLSDRLLFAAVMPVLGLASALLLVSCRVGVCKNLASWPPFVFVPVTKKRSVPKCQNVVPGASVVTENAGAHALCLLGALLLFGLLILCLLGGTVNSFLSSGQYSMCSAPSKPSN